MDDEINAKRLSLNSCFKIRYKKIPEIKKIKKVKTCFEIKIPPYSEIDK